MKRNAAKIKITVSDNGAICLELIKEYKLAYTAKQYNDHIENYIRCFNKFAEENILKPESTAFGNERSCIAYLSYYSLTDLFSNSRGLYKKEDFDLKESATARDVDRRTALDGPTIHMTLGNIIPNEDNSLDEPFKRFARYMDSSIWNYYAPIIIKNESKDGSDPERYDFSHFISVIQAIINNSFYKTPQGVTNLYEINVTKEYADINERILMQSKLMEVSGHGKNVSPFLFHSERKVMNEIERMKSPNNGCDKNNIVEEILNYKWRILLVDDHDIKPMRIGEQSSNVAKLDIIEKAINDLFKNETVVTRNFGNDKAQIYIDSVSNLKEAQDALKSKKYEIILLDYLLDDNGKGGREYGYELLKGIWAKEENKAEDVKYKDYIFDYKKGPDNRFYFMFISAFTTAVSERLLAEGWARSEDYWYIGEGACPINTPYLFQYRLLHIMEKRLKEMGLAKWNLKKHEEQNDSSKNENAKKNPFACLLKTIHETFTKEVVEEHNNIYTELIKEIYSSKDEARQRANEKFQDVLDLLYHYKSLIRDTHFTENWFDSNESVLVTEFIKSHMAYEGVLEHLTQLVYLTAFGTVRQWPEMWEEYLYIKSRLGKIDAVETYIVNLKNSAK